MTVKEQLLSHISPDIELIEQAMKEDVQALKGSMESTLVDVLEYGLFSGGKRFRPLLAVIAARLCGGGGGDVYRLALGFEYLHMATLFHDDVIDQADTRRGQPSIYKAFGLEAAILTGDFLHARAMEIVGRYGGMDALAIFCQATAGIVNGEFVQLRNAQNLSQNEEMYFDAIRGKTALLIAATLKIGALFGGGDRQQQDALYSYGTQLGYAFQIADDLLDYLGDEKKTGKRLGNDLAEGKMTLPLILALEQAGEEERKELIAIVGNPGRRATEFARVCPVIERLGGFHMARKRALDCLDRALENLKIFSETGSDRAALTMLAQYALQREK